MRECYLRSIIHASNGDAVAMCHSYKPLKIMNNTENKKDLIIDISQIVPGDYYIDLVLIDFGELGAETRMDAVQYVFNFRIMETPDFNLNKSWYRAGWGYINNGYIVEKTDEARGSHS